MMVFGAPRQGVVWGYQALLHTFLLLHSSILEPDFHLCLVQLKSARNFDPAGARQVLVKVELLLQLGQLFGSEVGASRVVEAAGAGLSPVPVRIGLRNCKRKQEN